jgi:hypothetical protein
MNRSWLMVWVLIAVALVGRAHAAECRGARFEERQTVDGTPLVLNGLGLREATILKVKVYVAALYAAQKTPDPATVLKLEAPVVLTLQFVRGVGRGDITKAFEEGFSKTDGGQKPELKARITLLNGWMTDVREGDRLTFVAHSGKGLTFSINGSDRGSVLGDEFSRAFLSIWLGAEPPNASLKAGLLGGSCG